MLQRRLDDAGWNRRDWCSREWKSRPISNPLAKTAGIILSFMGKKIRVELKGWSSTTAARMNRRWVKPEAAPCTSSSVPDRDRVHEMWTEIISKFYRNIRKYFTRTIREIWNNSTKILGEFSVNFIDIPFLGNEESRIHILG